MGGSDESIDRSMKGIDADASTFDPTSGDSLALKRNNNDGVWVEQVRMHIAKGMGRSITSKRCAHF